MDKQKKEAKISRKMKGVVVSVAMDKTAAVEVTLLKTLRKYHKKYRSTKKYLVHDENNTAKVGDTVRIEECKPYSKNKRWKIISKKA